MLLVVVGGIVIVIVRVFECGGLVRLCGLVRCGGVCGFGFGFGVVGRRVLVRMLSWRRRDGGGMSLLVVLVMTMAVLLQLPFFVAV